MLFQLTTKRTVAEIERELEASATKHKFGILHVHDLQETMKKKGIELAMECRVYEVCNPVQAKRVLEADGAISTALPCRISLYGGPGAYTLATIRPTAMLEGFGKPEIKPIAEEVERVIVQMMKDAAGE